MSRIDFNKGMEAGARPFEEKFKKQSEGFDKAAHDINQKLDDINYTTDSIIDDLNSIEKKRLYDLNTIIDIADLGNDEKELLMAVLYTLVSMTDHVTEYQQAFLRSVKNYLNVKNVQTSADLSKIENIKNINDQKAILQTIIEFLFLENSDHRYMDEYVDVIEYFSVNKNGIREIQECIDRIYKATGLQGIAENHGYIPEEKVKIFENDCNINEDNSTIEDVKSFVKTNEIIESGVIIQSHENIQYKNKKLYIKGSIRIYGELSIENCDVTFDNQDANQYIEVNGGVFNIIASNIYSNYNCLGGNIKALNNSKIIMKECNIYKQENFLESVESSVNFIDSTFYNLYGKLIKATDTQINAENIKFENCVDIKYGKTGSFISLFDRGNPLFECETCDITFYKCGFYSSDEIISPVLVKLTKGRRLIINECSFKNIKSNGYIFEVENYESGTVIKNSKFIDCNPISIKGKCDIDSSEFLGCCTSVRNELAGAISIECAKDINIKNCMFKNCINKNNDGDGGAINLSMYLIRENKSIIEECTFIKCEANKRGGAIKVLSASEFLLTIKKCRFKDCQAQEGLAVYHRGEEKKLLKTKIYSSAKVIDCVYTNCSNV